MSVKIFVTGTRGAADAMRLTPKVRSTLLSRDDVEATIKLGIAQHGGSPQDRTKLAVGEKGHALDCIDAVPTGRGRQWIISDKHRHRPVGGWRRCAKSRRTHLEGLVLMLRAP